jgi:hypothetical protein
LIDLCVFVFQSQLPLSLLVEGSDRAVLLAALSGSPARAASGQLGQSLQELKRHLELLLEHAQGPRADASVGRALQGALGSHAQVLTDAAYEGAVKRKKKKCFVCLITCVVV